MRCDRDASPRPPALEAPSQYSDAVHHAKTRATRAMLACPTAKRAWRWPGAIDDLNRAWDDLTNAIVRQRDERGNVRCCVCSTRRSEEGGMKYDATAETVAGEQYATACRPHGPRARFLALRHASAVRAVLHAASVGALMPPRVRRWT